MFSSVVYISVQTNVARNAFRAPTMTPQYMTLFAMEQFCDQLGVNVSITVWQLRFDKFVVFLRDSCAS